MERSDGVGWGGGGKSSQREMQEIWGGGDAIAEGSSTNLMSTATWKEKVVCGTMDVSNPWRGEYTLETKRPERERGESGLVWLT